MIKNIFKLFSKHEEELHLELPKIENAKFVLKAPSLIIGTLFCEGGEWNFEYSNEFKTSSHGFNTIVGFPDIEKIYKSSELWPFFQVRIPGLKQPQILDIIHKGKIDINNQVALLKRFGNKTITDPYILDSTL